MSNNGGVLSHMAILAREKHIPVVVNFSITEGSVKIGDKVTIDGDTGEVQKYDG